MIESRTTRGLLLRVDGSYEVVWSKDAKPDGEEICRWVECGIFCSAPVRRGMFSEYGITGYCDDLGMYEQDPSIWWSSQLAALCGTHQVLFGNVLLYGPADEEGYDTSFPEELILKFSQYPNL